MLVFQPYFLKDYQIPVTVIPLILLLPGWKITTKRLETNITFLQYRSRRETQGSYHNLRSERPRVKYQLCQLLANISEVLQFSQSLWVKMYRLKIKLLILYWQAVINEHKLFLLKYTSVFKVSRPHYIIHMTLILTTIPIKVKDSGKKVS